MIQDSQAHFGTREAQVSCWMATLLLLIPGWLAGQQRNDTLIIRDVRVFDGAEIHPRTTVVALEGRIEAVGIDAEVPPGATVIDGNGLTLLPGLTDAHMHVGRQSLASANLEQALMFGVTTALDMFSEPAVIARLRDEQENTGAPTRADVFSAGALITIEGGHGAQFGGPFPPTIKGADEAERFVDDRIAEGSDYIKIVYDFYGTIADSTEPRASWRGRFPSIDRATLGAVIRAAHARGKLVVVHVLNLASARHALAEGADGLAHLFVDDLPDEEFVEEAAQRGVFVIPTLSLLKGYTGVVQPVSLADSSATAYLPPENEAMFRLIGSGANEIPDPAARIQRLNEVIRRLAAGHVALLAGTDAWGNPGTAPGLGLHEELESLVEAGLSPAKALATATSIPAETFGLRDRGRIAVGMRADLVLVRGDPTADISATRNIVAIWKLGIPVDRASFRARHAGARAAYEALQEPGVSLVADFEADEQWPTATVGTWATFDREIALSVVEGGAAGTNKSLLIKGTIAPDTPVGSAGATYWPYGPIDLSSKSEIAFWAKGTGSTYGLKLNNPGLSHPPTHTFVAGPEWVEVIIPLSAYSGIDLRRVITIVFANGDEPGEFSLSIDEVRIR